MNSDIILSAAMLSGDPFSDSFAVDIKDQPPHKTVLKKDMIEVPILDPLPHLTAWSPQPSISTLSTASSPTHEFFDTPITWSNADLMYLLSCLLPDLLLTSRLIFSPPLEDLATTSSPICLRLFKKISVGTPPLSTYSKDAPIGTGRPRNKILIAEADTKCTTAGDARRSLAQNLLANQQYAAYMLDKYNVLPVLYTSSTPILLSLQRGMIEMLGVSELEWYERLDQLGGQVDDACTLEARLEVFLLGIGMKETEDWVRTVELAVGMEERDRRVWAGVYADAAAFLWRVCGEMY